MWFAERMGAVAAARMLGEEGWRPTAAEAQATLLPFLLNCCFYFRCWFRTDASLLSPTFYFFLPYPAGPWLSGLLVAQAVGLVKEVVPDADSDFGGPLRARAQALAEQWACEGKGRSLRAGSAAATPSTAAGQAKPAGPVQPAGPSDSAREGPLVARLKAVNAAESAALAAAFVSPRFLAALQASAAAKGKGKLAMAFAALRHTQPLWSRL